MTQFSQMRENGSIHTVTDPGQEDRMSTKAISIQKTFILNFFEGCRKKIDKNVVFYLYLVTFHFVNLLNPPQQNVTSRNVVERLENVMRSKYLDKQKL